MSQFQYQQLREGADFDSRHVTISSEENSSLTPSQTDNYSKPLTEQCSELADQYSEQLTDHNLGHVTEHYSKQLATNDDSVLSQSTHQPFQQFTLLDRSSSSSNSSKNFSSQTDVKYTRLKPTHVVEEGFDCDTDDRFGSLILLTSQNVRGRRRKCRRYHMLICVLLGIALLIVVSFLLYFFVIFPSQHGKIVYPDGKTHIKDQAFMKKQGKNVVATSCGLVRGSREKGAYVFKGIPYAMPPTSKRRWKAPEARSYRSGTCWNNVLNATHFGSKCVQTRFNDSTAIEGNEDCLFVNVWTPSLNPAMNLPVMVWLHSGDLLHGSGHMPGMSPSPELATARTTRAVYVSVNYRLGILGFLALDVLRAGKETRWMAGNYGIMDQQLALTWVKKNIRQFGGNEMDITVFGHGSGATCIQALLASHWSHGLFHKAWLSSPVTIINKTLDTACADNQKVMDATGCQSAKCLRSLSVEAITKASPWSLEPLWTLEQLFHTPIHSQIRNDLVIFDGHIVQWSPERIGPIGVDVSVVLGTTYFELSSLRSEKSVINMSQDEFDDLLVHYTSLYGTDTVIQMKRLYSRLPYLHYTSPAHFPPHPSASLAHLVGDIRNVCPLKILANSMEAVYSSSIYMYTAEIYPSHNINLSENETNSFIGWDMLAFFYGFDQLGFNPGQKDINFRNVMREEIMSFVRNGKPISSRWKTVDQNTGVIETDVTVRPASSEYFDHCQFWDRHQFFRYSWRDKS